MFWTLSLDLSPGLYKEEVKWNTAGEGSLTVRTFLLKHGLFFDTDLWCLKSHGFSQIIITANKGTSGGHWLVKTGYIHFIKWICPHKGLLQILCTYLSFKYFVTMLTPNLYIVGKCIEWKIEFSRVSQIYSTWEIIWQVNILIMKTEFILEEIYFSLALSPAMNSFHCLKPCMWKRCEEARPQWASIERMQRTVVVRVDRCPWPHGHCSQGDWAQAAQKNPWRVLSDKKWCLVQTWLSRGQCISWNIMFLE